jgi:hypothetical protein
MAQIPELHAEVVPRRPVLRLSSVAICHKEEKAHTRIFTAVNILKFPKFVEPRSISIHIHLALAIQLEGPAETKLRAYTTFQHHADRKNHMKSENVHLSH